MVNVFSRSLNEPKISSISLEQRDLKTFMVVSLFHLANETVVLKILKALKRSIDNESKIGNSRWTLSVVCRTSKLKFVVLKSMGSLLKDFQLFLTFLGN